MSSRNQNNGSLDDNYDNDDIRINESTPLLQQSEESNSSVLVSSASNTRHRKTYVSSTQERDDDVENGLNKPKVKNQSETEETPVPWRQFSIVLFLQLAEPLTSQVIYPFLPELIRDVGITKGDDTQVAFYVGVLQSLFFLTQSLTVLHWSRLSDQVGRKPIILTGLFGLSLSMYLFGLSRQFWFLVTSRALSGALNGNIGVIKSIVGEITDETNVARTFAYQPIAWSTGSTIGPLIGGSLSRPAERFPGFFGNSQFLRDYPYFLACAIPATFTIIAWVVTFMFLDETNPTSFSFSSYLGIDKLKDMFAAKKSTDSFDASALGISPVLISTSSRTISASSSITVVSPLSSSSINGKDALLLSQIKSKRSPSPKSVPLLALLTPRVLLSAGNYALLSLLDISYRAIQPVFFSTPTSLGGLSLSPPTIGYILAFLGIINGLFQVCCFARLNKRIGTKKCYLIGIASGVGIFASFVGMTLVVRSKTLGEGWVRWVESGSNGESGVSWMDVGFGGWIIWMLIVLQLIFTVLLNMCYASVFIYITASAPSKRTLGATNGLSQTSVSIMRAIGPAVTNSLFSFSLQLDARGRERCDSVLKPEIINTNGRNEFGCGLISGYIMSFGWLVYGVMLIICAVSYGAGTLLPEEVWKRAPEPVEEDVVGETEEVRT